MIWVEELAGFVGGGEVVVVVEKRWVWMWRDEGDEGREGEAALRRRRGGMAQALGVLNTLLQVVTVCNRV